MIINLSLTRHEDEAVEGSGAEERVRHLVRARLEGSGITASRVNVYRAVETA